MSWLVSVVDVLIKYKFVIAFYALIILIVYFNRKKFTFQAKFIALFRTKIGIKLMDKIANRHRELLRIVGISGIGIAYLGMLFIVYFIIQGVYQLIFVPEAPAVLSPVIPGVPIPGSPIVVPFWYGIISLFVVVVVHEFSHGVIARAQKIKVDHSGIVFFGPLIGAFVEPNEKELKKAGEIPKYSIFAAGPFSNIILALLALFLLIIFFTHPPDATWDVYYPKAMMIEQGITVGSIVPNSSAEKYGLRTDVTYNKLNSIEFSNLNEFFGLVNRLRPNETAILGDMEGNNYTLITGTHEGYKHLGKMGVGYIGISDISTPFILKQNSPFYKLLFDLLAIIGRFLFWIHALSLGIGLANLLPLGPIDGGRMLQQTLHKIFGEKKGNIIWTKLSIGFLIVIIILVVVPILRAVLKI